MLRDERIGDNSAANQMLLDDPLENRRIARRVPRAFRIHDGDGAALADPQAVRFRPQNAALLGETELLQPALEKVPRGQAAILLAAFRVRLIAAEKNVAPRDVNADALRDGALRIRRRTHRDSIRGPVRSAAPCSRGSPTRRR